MTGLGLLMQGGCQSPLPVSWFEIEQKQSLPFSQHPQIALKLFIPFYTFPLNHHQKKLFNLQHNTAKTEGKC